jgi:hypothetical protein
MIPKGITRVETSQSQIRDIYITLEKEIKN